MHRYSVRLLSLLVAGLLLIGCGGQGTGGQGGQSGANEGTLPAVATTERTTGPAETAGAPVTTAQATVPPTIGTGPVATPAAGQGSVEGGPQTSEVEIDHS
jgi:hypothetical protein